jgi:hypothetical protein
MENKITIMSDLRSWNTPATLRALLIPLYSQLDFSKFKDYEMIEPKKGYPYPGFFQHCDGKMALDFYKNSGYEIEVINCNRYEEGRWIPDRESPSRRYQEGSWVLNVEPFLTRNIKDLGRIVINVPGCFQEYLDIDGRLKKFFSQTDVIFTLSGGVDCSFREAEEVARKLEEKLGTRVLGYDCWKADPSNGYESSGFFMLDPLSSFTGCHP